MSGEPELLDIEIVIARWDEIIARTEAGEIFVISIQGQPKVLSSPLNVTLFDPLFVTLLRRSQT